MQLPITSRLKRKPSALKQATPKAKIIKKGEDKNVTSIEEVDTPGSMEAVKDQCGPNDMRPECVAYRKMTPDQVKAAEVKNGRRILPTTKKIETTTIEEGKDVIAPTYSKRTGDVQTNFEGRQLGRQTKFKNRLVRQSRNKLAKADDKMASFKNKNKKDGVFTAPKAGDKGYRKYKKLESKQLENTSELKDFETAVSNQSEVMRSGKTIGKQTRMDEDRQDTAGDQTPEQRIQQVAAENNITTASSGQAANAVNVPSGTEDGESQFNVGELESFDPTKFGEYNAVSKLRKGYQQKAKSMATKKLQGAQGKLPSHLQEAIKAAPDKKSVLKKSYFKNK